MKSICIYLNTACNLNCDYCYVNKDGAMMTRKTLEAILRWFIDQEGDEKDISFMGGEPLLSLDLLLGLKDFFATLQTSKKIVISEMPTNGCLFDREMILRVKAAGLKFAFSLDGDKFEHNKYRFKDVQTFDLVMKNLALYRELYETPKIKCVVHPEQAQDLHKRIGGLIDKGFKNIHILPAFGVRWAADQVAVYKESIDKIVAVYLRLLDTGSREVQIHPIMDEIKRVMDGEYFDTYNSCPKGREAVFMPDGKAYACHVVMQFENNDMTEKFSIGHIDTGIDVVKMQKLTDYRICHDVDLGCKSTVPGSGCKKICLCFDAETRNLFSPQEASVILDVHNATFAAVDKVLAPQREVLRAHAAGKKSTG